MNLCGSFRTENSDQRDAGQYDRPLGDAEGHALRPAPEKKPEGREGSADQQINGDIVKAAPEALYAGTPFKAVVQAAHKEHHDEADTIDQRGAELQPRIGPKQQQDQGRDGEQGADTMANSVADFLEDRAFRRFLSRGFVFRAQFGGSFPGFSEIAKGRLCDLY